MRWPCRSTDGTGLSVQGECKDKAGNTTSATVSGINIDQVKPGITAVATVNGNPYTANTWTNQSVIVTFSCTDDRSGVDPASVTAPVTVSVEGITSAVSGTCKDKAGNQSTVTFGPIKIDKTAPVFTTCAANLTSLWPPNHKMHDITVTIALGSSASPATWVLTSVTSNEPDNGLGDGDTANDIQGWAAGTADTKGQLRAERSGGGSGRVYTLVYTATDQAGNSAACNLHVTVAHDQGN